ncbi:hypothetical protein ANCCEY_03921 [Ancylostoma ceylanicum]|uniref:G-protein coupled receptors family 1 profile domain-containing protein n=1 Tax=Ancylostoma ceylanicum TaxID=53326 RepID=A0A0D6M0L7_9BILA|nr:hypothetical protein ANCCEY_03921 [Ancylostoma ceylanicum]
MNKTYGNTRRLHIQLCKALAAQFASPFILLHIPFYISVLAPLFEGRTGEASNYFPFLFAWCPAINPLIAIYFVREYRHRKKTPSSCSTLFLAEIRKSFSR